MLTDMIAQQKGQQLPAFMTQGQMTQPTPLFQPGNVSPRDLVSGMISPEQRAPNMNNTMQSGFPGLSPGQIRGSYSPWQAAQGQNNQGQSWNPYKPEQFINQIGSSFNNIGTGIANSWDYLRRGYNPGMGGY